MADQRHIDAARAWIAERLADEPVDPARANELADLLAEWEQRGREAGRNDAQMFATQEAERRGFERAKEMAQAECEERTAYALVSLRGIERQLALIRWVLADTHKEMKMPQQLVAPTSDPAAAPLP